jgi:hypothetical protein
MATTATSDPFARILIGEIIRTAQQIQRLTGESCAHYLEDARTAKSARELADIHSELCDWLADVQDQRRDRRMYWLTEFGWPVFILACIVGWFALGIWGN